MITVMSEERLGLPRSNPCTVRLKVLAWAVVGIFSYSRTAWGLISPVLALIVKFPLGSPATIKYLTSAFSVPAWSAAEQHSVRRLSNGQPEGYLGQLPSPREELWTGDCSPAGKTHTARPRTLGRCCQCPSGGRGAPPCWCFPPPPRPSPPP